MAADWTALGGPVAVLRASRARMPTRPQDVARRDQINAAMRAYLTSLGVDVDNPDTVHALLACCVVIQYAARHDHAIGKVTHEAMEAVQDAAGSVAQVVVNFVPDEVLR